MRKNIIILYLSTSLLSCSIHSNVYDNTVNQQFVSEETDSIELVKSIPKEIGFKKEFNNVDPCIHNEYVQYNPVLKNECSNDNRLYVRFNLSIDTIINDTVLIKYIEIAEIRDSNRKIVERKECEESFLKQLREKVYLYKCKNIKRKQLECVAFPPYILGN
ncbi:MAG: hypothetical protein IJ916_10995 [Paludibacteraceae bacterium]|nr:hypothetical protein [Paludibacteraceae bacterium]